MVYFPREIEDRLRTALKQFPAVLVTGARQSGKSTLLRQCAGDGGYVTLDDPAQRALACQDPRLFLSSHPPPVIIDEIQYAPGLFPYIKLRIDANRRTAGQYRLTGSQTFPLMAGIGETLAGRIAVLELYPFSWHEIQGVPGFSPARVRDESEMAAQIVKGFYPEFLVTPDLNPELWFGSYLSTYLERDVRNLRQIGDLGRYQTFVSLLATRAGNLLNLSELAREAGISQPTAKDWLTVLEATSVVYLLRPYHHNLAKRLVKMPKLYFVDTGLLCYLLGIHSAERMFKAAERGRVFENMVVMEVRKRVSAAGHRTDLCFYRTPAGVEVDLILMSGTRAWAIEIKMTKTIDRSMANGLRRFQSDEGMIQGRLLSLQEEPLPIASEIRATHWLDGIVEAHAFGF